MTTDKDKYLIVTTGRSGSNLFAAICADAGANFDIPGLPQQNRMNFRSEHLTLIAAYKWFSRAQKISKSLLPSALGQRFCEIMMKARLSEVLGRATFLKSAILVWMVHPIYQLGFRPHILVAYRKFSGYCFDKYKKNGWKAPELLDTYTSVYSTALLQLKMFGGCTVSYEEVSNPAETDWARAVSRVTGLDEQRLLQSRDKLIQPGNPIEDGLVYADDRVQAIYAQLLALKGTVIRPGNP